jgi:hypothetical protein
MSITERIKLPSGAWIQIRDAHTLRRGDRQKVLRSVTDTDNDMVAGLDMINGLLRVLVIDWSYDLPLPGESPESLDLLPIEDDDALTEAIEPIRKMLFPEKPDPKDVKDPASPTAPSAA